MPATGPPVKRRPNDARAGERETGKQMQARHALEKAHLDAICKSEMRELENVHYRRQRVLDRKQKAESTAAREAVSAGAAQPCGECGVEVAKGFFVCAHCHKRVCDAHKT
ncbi:hypothetical protein KIPB_015621, partial [Kipferlia bialata]|eukprot:g15621.t1